MKTLRLTKLEQLALRCGVYGGIPKHTLDAARARARRKLNDPRNVICHNFAFTSPINLRIRHTVKA